jgi:hypothetical protein
VGGDRLLLSGARDTSFRATNNRRSELEGTSHLVSIKRQTADGSNRKVCLSMDKEKTREQQMSGSQPHETIKPV